MPLSVADASWRRCSQACNCPCKASCRRCHTLQVGARGASAPPISLSIALLALGSLALLLLLSLLLSATDLRVDRLVDLGSLGLLLLLQLLRTAQLTRLK